MKNFCLDKENCRRKKLMASIGSTEHVGSRASCCDVCNPEALLLVSGGPGPVRRQRRRRVRTVTSDSQIQQLRHSLKIRVTPVYGATETLS